MGVNVFGRIPVSCVVLLLMVAFVTGCETGDSFDSSSESRSGRSLAGGGSASGSVPHFSSIAAISFLSREDVEAAQEVRAQEINGQEGGGQLRQLVYVGTSDGRPLNYRAEELSAGLPVFYTPVANPGQSNLGPVWDRQGQVQLPLGPRPVEYTWTLPPDPSGKPILLFFNQRETASALGNFTALPEDYHVVEGNTVVLRLEPVEGGWRASINGEVLPESATSRISGYLGPPAFYSRRHGEHSVTTQALDPDDSFIPGGEGGVKTIRYFQKGLTLTEPLPEPNEENPREPMRIENTIAWSDDSALTDEEVSWSVGTSDKTYYGEGTDIAVVWDPLRQTFNEILNRAPTDEELEDIEVTKFEELDMSVTARTRVYEEKEASNLPSLEYVLRQNFGALGANEFHIINTKVLPEEPFTEEEPFAELEADIVLVGPDPANYDVTWFVDIKNPEGEVVLSEFQSGQGYQVYAFWDGIVDGQLVEEPETYQFHIRVDACESDGGGGAFRAISAQETTSPECLGEVAKADVPLSVNLKIKEIEFWSSKDTRRSDDKGPFLAYDYVNDKLTAGPDWKLEQDSMQPVILKGGETYLIKAKFSLVGPVNKSTLTKDSFALQASINGAPFDLPPTSLELDGVGGGTLTVPFEARSVIGRFSTVLDWSVKAEHSLTLKTLEAEFRTPVSGDTGHMIYSVFGPIPEGSLSGHPTKYPWYHPEHFRDEESESGPPVNGSPIRSPLDLATTWAAGVSTDGGYVNEAEAVQRLTVGFYEKGGYHYTPSTELSNPVGGQVSWEFYRSIVHRLAECADASNWVKVCANFLGIPARVSYIEDPGFQADNPRTYLWTNYVLPTGAKFDAKQPGYSSDFYAPSHINPRKFGLSLGGGSERLPDGNINPQPWVQFQWTYHQVVEHVGVIYDPASRGVSGNLAANKKKNPQDYLNQKNMDVTSGFVGSHTRTYGFPPAQAVLDNALANFLSVSPSANPNPVANIDQYLDALLYIGGPNTGFNRKEFIKGTPLSSTLLIGRSGGGSQ